MLSKLMITLYADIDNGIFLLGIYIRVCKYFYVSVHHSVSTNKSLLDEQLKGTFALAVCIFVLLSTIKSQRAKQTVCCDYDYDFLREIPTITITYYRKHSSD